MTQGYIGITNTPERRLQEHKGQEWFDDRCEMLILQNGLTRQEARTIEQILRPRPNIGWNKAVGGGDPPRPVAGKNSYNVGNQARLGIKDSAETRAKKSKNNGRYVRTEEWKKQAGQNLKYLRAEISCLDCRKVVKGKPALREHLKKH